MFALSLTFGFVLVKAQENEIKNNDVEIKIKYKPEKTEPKVPQLLSRQLGPFKELDDFVREKIAEHPRANYFFLTPSGHASQQGIIDENQNNILTLNSQGFKMNWALATDTMIIAANKLGLLAQANPQPLQITEIATGTRVKVFGNWDGSQLVAKRVIVLERRADLEVEKIILRLREALQKAGINIDLTPLLQQLQR